MVQKCSNSEPFLSFLANRFFLHRTRTSMSTSYAQDSSIIVDYNSDSDDEDSYSLNDSQWKDAYIHSKGCEAPVASGKMTSASMRRSGKAPTQFKASVVNLKHHGLVSSNNLSGIGHQTQVSLDTVLTPLVDMCDNVPDALLEKNIQIRTLKPPISTQSEENKRKRDSRSVAPLSPSPEMALYVHNHVLIPALYIISQKAETFLSISEMNWPTKSMRLGNQIATKRSNGESSGVRSSVPATKSSKDKEVMRRNQLLQDFYAPFPSYTIDKMTNTNLAQQAMHIQMPIVLKMSASASSKQHKKDTEGSLLQTSRVPVEKIGRMYTMYCGICEILRAQALYKARTEFETVSDSSSTSNNDAVNIRWGAPSETQFFDPCDALVERDNGTGIKSVCIAAPSTTSDPTLVMSARLSTKGGILEEARRLASEELDATKQTISVTMQQYSPALTRLCHNVLGSGDGRHRFYKMASTWAAIILITYLSLEYRGRRLFSYSLSELDLAIVRVLENYAFRAVSNAIHHEPKRVSIAKYTKTKRQKTTSGSSGSSSSNTQVGDLNNSKAVEGPATEEAECTSDYGSEIPSVIADNNVAPVDLDNSEKVGSKRKSNKNGKQTSDKQVSVRAAAGKRFTMPEKEYGAHTGMRNTNKLGTTDDPAKFLELWDSFWRMNDTNVVAVLNHLLHDSTTEGNIRGAQASRTLHEKQTQNGSDYEDSDCEGVGTSTHTIESHGRRLSSRCRRVIDPRTQGASRVASFVSYIPSVPTSYGNHDDSSSNSIQMKRWLHVGFEGIDTRLQGTQVHVADLRTEQNCNDKIAFLYSKITCDPISNQPHASDLNHSQDPFENELERSTRRLNDLCDAFKSMRAQALSPLTQEKSTPKTHIPIKSRHVEILDGMDGVNNLNFQPEPVSKTGHVRSWMTVQTQVAYSPSDQTSIGELASILKDEALNMCSKISKEGLPATKTVKIAKGERKSCNVIPSGLPPSMKDVSSINESACIPIDSLVLGLRASQNISKYQMGSSVQRNKTSTHKDFCYHSIMCANPHQHASTCPLADQYPPPMANVTDMKLKQSASATQTDVPMTLSMQLLVYRPRRVVDVVKDMNPCVQLDQIRSLLLHAALRASYIDDLAQKLSQTDVSAAIRSTRKVDMVDITLAMNLTVDSALIGRRGNMVPSMGGTAWVQISGSGCDFGVTPLGTDGSNPASDNRQHGTICCSQEVTNCLLYLMADKVFTVDENLSYGGQQAIVATPNEGRGIGRFGIVGLHKGFDNLYNAMQSAREHYVTEPSQETPYICNGLKSSSPGDDLKEDILINPIWVYSQQLSPECKPDQNSIASTHSRSEMSRVIAGDSTTTDIRYALEHLNILDRTAPGRAICSGPRLRPPDCSNDGANYYSAAHEEPTVLFAMASLIARYAELAQRVAHNQAPVNSTYAEIVNSLRDAIEHFLFSESSEEQSCQNATRNQIAAKVLIMLNVCYPCTWKINKPMLAPHIAKLAPACLRNKGKLVAAALIHKMSENSDATSTGTVHTAELKKKFNLIIEPSCPEQWPSMNTDELNQLRQWWRRFYPATPDNKMGAWAIGIAPILEELIKRDGTQNVGLNEFSQIRNLIERNMIDAAWYVHSPDGVSPPNDPECPIYGVTSHHHINAIHVAPRFATRFGVEARGALFGMKLFQQRSILALLDAPELVPFVNVHRLEGQMTHRLAYDSTIWKSQDPSKTPCPRTERTDNATAQENCTLSQGTRFDRIGCCHDQRCAWDANLLFLAPLIVEITPPKKLSARSRGSIPPIESNKQQMAQKADTRSYAATQTRQTLSSHLLQAVDSTTF